MIHRLETVLRSRLLLVLACVAGTGIAPPQGEAQSLEGLRARAQGRIAATPAEAVGLYVRDLTRPDSLLVGADTRFHAASTMKVAVLIQVFRDADAGRIRLTDRLPVINSFRSIVDGSPFSVDSTDDSDSTLYRRVGHAATVRDLVELMITVSSNLATDLLIDRVSPARAQATALALGADSMVVLRGVEDGAAYRAGLNNTTTARALGALFAAIAEGRAASPASCAAMLAVLRRQHFNEGIPAGLPRGTIVAHKTGEIEGVVHHDAGVVYAGGRPRYVIAILTRGVREKAASARLMADLSAMVHEAVGLEAAGASGRRR